MAFLHFQRTSFLITVYKFVQPIRCTPLIERPYDISTPVSKLFRKNSLENCLSWYINRKHNLHTSSSFLRAKAATAFSAS